VDDITDGARSLGELDFAAMCRRRGLPEPDRQALRRTARGNAYLDAAWHGATLAVEIDGSQHTAGLALVADHLRQDEVTLQRGRVLRISLLGLRVSGDDFLDQIARGLSGPRWS
jgi:very-short-patch-repair endonuclease